MTRFQAIDDRLVLSAARELFLERGVAATTAEVAARAGVSEGSLFKRWPTKAELFHAALRLGGPPQWVLELGTRVGRGRVEEQLREIGLQCLEFYRTLLPLVTMAWSEPSTRNRLIQDEDKPGPVRGTDALKRYLEEEMGAGRLRMADADIAARTFLGALHNYAWVELTFGAERGELPPEKTFVKQLVSLLLVGLAPGGSQESAKSTATSRPSKNGKRSS